MASLQPPLIADGIPSARPVERGARVMRRSERRRVATRCARGGGVAHAWPRSAAARALLPRDAAAWRPSGARVRAGRTRKRERVILIVNGRGDQAPPRGHRRYGRRSVRYGSCAEARDVPRMLRWGAGGGPPGGRRAGGPSADGAEHRRARVGALSQRLHQTVLYCSMRAHALCVSAPLLSCELATL